ncbi:MAG TPA: hypothetical protein VFB86_07310, partial [Bacteroidales bacterium]|nr:hypothetical protein [Bacteroidales bacterium]
MKRYAILIMLILPGLLAYGQGKTFKNRNKQSLGSVDSRLNNLNIKPVNNAKPANTYPFSQIRTMAAPVIAGKEDQVTHVIRSKGRPVYIERKSSEVKAAPEERLYKFLNETKELSGKGDFRETFRISGIKTDSRGITHIRTLQQYKGVDIYGSESTLHIDAGRERFTGSFHKPGPDTKTSPTISAMAAVQKVVNDVSRETVYKELSSKEKDLLDYGSPECSLVLL